MSSRRLTITLIGVKSKSKDSLGNNMDHSFENDEFDWDAGQNDGFMEENFNYSGPQGQGGFRGPRGPGNFRNRHYQNAYGNYRGGYGPQGEYGPPDGPPPLGFGPGPGPNFGPRSNFGPKGNFGMGPDFGPRPMMWGRGFGPDGPPMRNDHPALRYLARCGVNKENLKNLPRALLQLIEPTYCGLCSMSLESFAFSRMHYTSKNHQKNQKKWFLNHPEMGAQGGPKRKEIPVKSRDLYCELCDVHITSKSHADSHYAGRPHRAVVEGRKAPKNAALLKRGMEGRLEMLIRREKKHLKTEDSTPKEEPKDNKPVSPDLYCEICKTSVTCSEQMTMHLNGKRHLTKEKQHILKMMTGQAGQANDENQEKNDGEEGAEENAEAADEGAGDAANGQEDFDWGNGSGNWDEPAANNA